MVYALISTSIIVVSRACDGCRGYDAIYYIRVSLTIYKMNQQ